ncbi:MAG: MBL fold metallo-hydrolase [bacterium]
MKIIAIINNPFQECTYIVYDEKSGEAAIIDCGALFEKEEIAIANFIEENKLTVKHLLNTHAHLDHTFGNHWAANKYGVKPMAHEADNPLMAKLPEHIRQFGLPIEVIVEPFGGFLKEGDTIAVGDGKLEVLHTPGHTAGGICFYCKEDNFIIVGDTLFYGSIGRTDLEGGSMTEIIRSIQTKLISLPDSTRVYCGHGPTTTIGDEKANNPYV